MEVSGKVAFVTGGAQSLGKAYCRALLQKGAKVCIADVNQEQGESTETELKGEFGVENVQYIFCDVANKDRFKEAFDKAIEKFGKIDIMINNAGIMHEMLWEKMVDINVKGVIQGSLLAIEHMRKDKGGSGGLILNVSSIAGIKIIPGSSLIPAYSGTKAAVVAFTRSWAEFSDQENLGIRLVCLCPAGADTPLLNADQQQTAISLDDQKFKKLYEEHKSKLLTADPLAEAVMRLVREEDNNGGVMVVVQEGAVYHKFD